MGAGEERLRPAAGAGVESRAALVPGWDPSSWSRGWESISILPVPDAPHRGPGPCSRSAAEPELGTGAGHPPPPCSSISGLSAAVGPAGTVLAVLTADQVVVGKTSLT